MDDSIATSRFGALTYLSPPGSLIQDTALQTLQSALSDCLSSRHIQLVLDLSRTQAVGGRALEILLDTSAQASAFGGKLELVNANELVKQIIVLTGCAEQLSLAEADNPLIASPPSATPSPLGRLGDILLRRQLLTPERMALAVQAQQESGRRVGQILVEKGWISEQDLLSALGEQLGLPTVSLRTGLYEKSAAALLHEATARRLQVLPLFKVHQTLTVATAEPQAIPVFDEITALTGLTVRVVLARREDIIRHLAEAFDGTDFTPELLEAQQDDLELIESQIPDDYTEIDQLAGGSPVINLVNGLIQRAIRDKASDIHIEITRGRSRVRFRVDGVLYQVMTPRAELHPAIVSRLKVMANLDIAERRLPQDGRIQVATQGRTVDLRFSSLPGIHGEKVVLRVLDKNQSILDVGKLGMSVGNLDTFRHLLTRSHGLILATGPTGSGKTTTLYAAINHLKSMETNIVTIEDPVEYQLDIINQNQVNEAIGLNFARMLKHVLRQDPDVVMVGEIRDKQTAEIAVQAALTGHLVLSTLHTNDALGAVSRLTDMGVEPYLLASALVGVVGQRLVRQVCPSCKTSFLAAPEVAARHGWSTEQPIRLARGRGCGECYDSGYKGRLGIHELLVMDEVLQSEIAKGTSRERLGQVMKAQGLKTLYDDGVQRALEGRTTLEEVARVIHDA